MFKHIIKCFLGLFLFFQFSFASNLNQTTLNNATISIIEECINSNNLTNKCKNPKFIKENLIKKGYKFDNKSLKKSIEFAINLVENYNEFGPNLIKVSEIALNLKSNNQTSENNKTNLPKNLKDKIYISFSSSENSNLNKNENLNLGNSSNLDTAEDSANYQTIKIKDKNLSSDTTFLIGSNNIDLNDTAIPNFSNFDDFLKNSDFQEYTQENDWVGALSKAKKYAPAIIAAGRNLYNKFRNGTAAKNGIDDEFVKLFMRQCLACHSLEELKQKIGDSLANKNEEDIIKVFLNNNPKFLKNLKDGLNNGSIHPNIDEFDPIIVTADSRKPNTKPIEPNLGSIINNPGGHIVMPNPKKDDDKDKLTPSQEKSIKKIDEIEHMLKSRNNLSGDVLDKGHIEKLNNARTGLQREINSLKNSLKNPNLSNYQKNIMQNSINKAQNIIGRINALIG